MRISDWSSDVCSSDLAFAGDIADVDGLGDGKVPGVRLGDDAVGDRVLGLALRSRGDGQFLVLVPRAKQHDVADAEAALGQRSGLVEDDRIQIARPLEGGAVPDQQTTAGAE